MCNVKGERGNNRIRLYYMYLHDFVFSFSPDVCQCCVYESVRSQMNNGKIYSLSLIFSLKLHIYKVFESLLRKKKTNVKPYLINERV